MTQIRLGAVRCVIACPSFATDMVKGAQIRAAITGSTVRGSMSDGSAYTEFHDADGTIRGKDFTGKWAVKDDTMCFTYGTDPATCYGVGMAATQVTRVLDGKPVGTGTLVTGNPNGI